MSLPHPGPNTARFQKAGARVDHLGIPADLLAEYRAKRVRYQLPLHAHLHYRALEDLRAEQPDIVHINDDSTMLSWGTASRRLGIPVIWHVRQERTNKLDPIFARIANKIVFIANSTRKRLPETHMGKSVVIHNASDTSTFFPAEDRAAVKRSLGLDPNRLTVGFAGRLRPSKRPEWAVQAAIDVLEEGIDAQFLIVGPDGTEGHYAQRLPEMVRRSNAPDRTIQFLGYRMDMPEIMRALDVFLLPSVAEPFGLVVTEAMASGAAVIATDAGGVREIIRHEETGLLTPSDDYGAFVAALRRLLTDHASRIRFAKAGTVNVEMRFTPERVTNEVIAVYESLL